MCIPHCGPRAVGSPAERQPWRLISARQGQGSSCLLEITTPVSASAFTVPTVTVTVLRGAGFHISIHVRGDVRQRSLAEVVVTVAVMVVVRRFQVGCEVWF